MATKPTSNLTDDTAEPSPFTEETLSTELWDDLEPARMAEREAVGRDEGYLSTTDNHQLYWQAWFDDTAEEPRRGAVALVHGYGEHCSRYDHVAVALVRAGYDVMAIDLRGHGRSTGPRGYVGHYSRYVDDLALLKRHTADRFPNRPLFVLGHSNGGLTALRYALRKPNRVTGFVVTSPLLRVAVQVSRIKKAAGKLTSRILPKLSLPSELKPEDLSHIDEVAETYRRDPLVFDTANARWFTEVQRSADDLFERAESLDQPFLFLVAGEDRVVDARTTESLFHQLGSLNRQLEVFPDLYHEILNERPWRVILRRIVIWMDQHRISQSD